jgi:hypothetical protein
VCSSRLRLPFEISNGVRVLHFGGGGGTQATRIKSRAPFFYYYSIIFNLHVSDFKIYIQQVTTSENRTLLQPNDEKRPDRIAKSNEERIDSESVSPCKSHYYFLSTHSIFIYFII